MKKVFSISLIVLLIATMLHLSVATHYCGGIEVASKVSLTGKLAHCDMQCSEMELPLPGTNFTKQCCYDVVTFCGIDSNYTPSFTFLPESYQGNFHVFAIPTALSVNSYISLIPSYTNVCPSGALMSTEVDLSSICVFRI